MLPGVNHQKLLGFVAKIVGHQDAEDVAQTVYLKLCGGTAPAHMQPTAWALIVAKSVALDYLRATKLEPAAKALDSESLEDVEVEDQGISEIEFMDSVAHRLLSIKPEWAQALTTYARLGTLEEAAAHLGLTVTALKKRMFQGRKALRETR